jgi:putative DNA primase/helicase
MTLSDLLSRLHSVRRDGDGYLALCPAHHDTDPSLRLSITPKGKVLVKCRAGCPTEDVMSALDLTMADLATMEPGDVHIEPVVSAPIAASPTAIASLQMKLDGYHAALTDSSDGAPVDAWNYAHVRFGLSDEDIDRLGLGYSDDSGTPRLIVPFRTPDGVARNYQGRALDPNASVRWLGPHAPRGGSWSPLGYFYGSAGTWSEVIITEGPGDALTVAAAGFDAIAIAGASRVSNPAIVDEIRSWVGDRTAIIAGDGDQAGRRFSATLAEGLTKRGATVHVMEMREGEDINSWRVSDPDAFPAALADRVNDLIGQTPITASEAALREWDESRYSLTDLGGARYLRDYIESIGSGVRYNEETGFYVLDGGVWRRDDHQRVRTFAQEVADTLRSLAAEAQLVAVDNPTQSNKSRASRLFRYAAHAQTTKGLDSMLRELQAVTGVPIRLEQFDRDHHLLAFRNGVVDLRTGTLQPHDPRLLITRRIEYDYNPDAKAPRWQKFLTEVFPNHPDMPAYIQRVVGYGITGSTDEQCFIVHYGKGGNGKSVFTETLTDLFRDITVTTPFSTFEQRPSGGIPNDLAALNGARLVFATEGEQGRIMAEALIKRVTGRDMISARFMRKEFFEFRPTFLLQLSTNNKPNFRGQDEGLWRRVKLIPWERNFAPSERDPKLGLKLLAEAEGIIAWAVAGAVDWYRRGSLEDPPAIKAATAEYRETSNALDGFIPGLWERADDSHSVLGQTLFESYLNWADDEHLSQREVWTRRTFFGSLEERGFTKRKTSKGITFDGVRRAKQTDSEPEWAAPVATVDSSEQASNTENDHPALRGADLDAL